MTTVQKIFLIITITTVFLGYIILAYTPVKASEQKIDISAYVTNTLKDYDAKLLEFSTTKTEYEYPNVVFNIILKNTGRNYFIPNGTLNIIDESSELTSKININIDNIILQPQQIYNFQVKWAKNYLDIGSYKADASIDYDGKNKIVASTNFSIAPVKTASSALAFVCLVGYSYLHYHYSLTFISGNKS